MGEEERSGERAPVWLVVGEKRGDNAQVRNLARRAGLDALARERSIVMKPEWVDGKPPVEASLEHVDLEKSDPLDGPWPDVVLCAGRRLASVALWIKRASGGKTRLVVVGKPRGRAADFDLIVVADHYVLPDAPNVVRHAYPLMEVDHAALAETKAVWAERLASVPRPLTAVFVGGPTGGLRFGVAEAHALLADARRLVAARGGALRIATSRRTPRAVVDALRAEAEPASDEALSVYDPSLAPIDNPYQGLLAVADHFVVTTDSLSMMLEVAQLGRPLSLFALGRASSVIERVLERVGLLRPIDPTRDPIPAGGVAARTLAALGRPIHSRDLTATARRLVADGRAAWSSAPLPVASGRTDEALDAVVRRVRALAGLPD